MARARLHTSHLHQALAVERARAYAGLAAGFSDPTEPTFIAARAMEIADLVVALRDLHFPAFSRLVSLPSPAESAPRDEGDLAPEYARLFLVPSPVTVSPFESVHFEGRMMGERSMCGQRDYRAAGVALSAKSRDQPDHIAVELEFMVFLALKEARRWDGGDVPSTIPVIEREIAFLREHLAPFAPRFARALVSAAPHEFYRRLALVLDSLVACDPSILERVLAEVAAEAGATTSKR